jgi:hypothetical protein
MSSTGTPAALVEVRAKRFIMSSFYELARAISIGSATWEQDLARAIDRAIKSSFRLSEDQSVENQLRIFLMWLGFSPVDVRWTEDVRVGRVYIGTSRIWKVHEKGIDQDPLMKAVLTSTVASLGSVVTGTAAKCEFVSGETLPPRFQACLQFSERVSERSGPTSVQIATTNLVRPIMSQRISIEDAAQLLLESSRKWLEGNSPELLEQRREEIAAIPAVLIHMAFKRSVELDQTEEIGKHIGMTFYDLVKDANPALSQPNHFLKGVGLLPKDQINELMFYEKTKEICGRSSEDFCYFIAHVWAGYSSKVFEKDFKAEKPLCGAGSTSLCIYTLRATGLPLIEG